MSDQTPQKIDPNQPAGNLAQFDQFLKTRTKAIAQVASSQLNPERLVRIVLACVTRTPKLKECSMASIFRSMLQAAELGLEPGSAIGSAYLVPYNRDCQLIVGYRGLIELAFRSGQISSIKANVVYQGDRFIYEEGIEPKLSHVPDFEASRDAKNITFAYCVIKLTTGGTIFDVMTRGEIDRIRGLSKSGSSGPWAAHYAEMAKKTVARRCLKYAPMSIEMQKAMALDAKDHGEDIADAEFMDFSDEETPELPSKTDKLEQKLLGDGE